MLDDEKRSFNLFNFLLTLSKLAVFSRCVYELGESSHAQMGLKIKLPK